MGLSCKRVDPSLVAAWVGAEAILKDDVEMEARLMLGEPGQVPSSEQRSAALEDLIDQALLLGQGQRLGARLDSAAFEQQRQLAKAGLSDQALSESLAARGVSSDYYRRRLERQTLADEAVRLKIRSQLVIRQEDLKGYYWEHVTDFRRPEAVRLRQVFSSRRAEVEKAQAELRLGEPFESVAARYSHGPEAARGGELGWMSRLSLPKDIWLKVAPLKPGELSSLYQSGFGWHLFRVDERRATRTLSLDEAAPEIHAELVKAREQPLYQDWLFLLRQSVVIKIEAGLEPSPGPKSAEAPKKKGKKIK